MNGQSEASQNLIALLDELRDELADAWLEAIRREMPDAKYSQRPPRRDPW